MLFIIIYEFNLENKGEKKELFAEEKEAKRKFHLASQF
jgi:hypothetical protein